MTCGPVRFACVALSGFDGRGCKSSDTVWVKNLALLRDEPRFGNSMTILTEAEVNYLSLGASTSEDYVW